MSHEFIATSWTTAGDAAPRRGDERSPFALADRIAAVAEAGWAGIGLVEADIQFAAQTVGLQTIRRMLENHGVKYVEVEFLGDWWTSGDRRRTSDRIRANLLVAAEALGARAIKVCGAFDGEVVDAARMQSEFERLCAQAEDIGTSVGLEALPFTNFSDVGLASQFVESVGSRNAGVFIDAWHVYRANTPVDSLPQLINSERIISVEIDDAFEPAPPYDKLWDDTVNNRQLPGDGDWDLPHFINVIRSMGYEGPWGVEIISEEHRRRSLHDEVFETFAATAHVFTLADAAQGHPA